MKERMHFSFRRARAADSRFSIEGMERPDQDNGPSLAAGIRAFFVVMLIVLAFEAVGVGLGAR